MAAEPDTDRQPEPITRRAQVANERAIDRLLAFRGIRALDPVLGLTGLRRIHPFISLIPVAIMFVLGIQTSEFGHMDTVDGIFPLMTVISALSPATGALSAIAYGVADLLQKFVSDDIYYEGPKTTGDYWGARGGYALAYSSLLVFGLAPGILSRLGSNLAHAIALGTFGRRANGAELTQRVATISRVIGGAVGGAAGGGLAVFAYQGLSAPAFLLRPNADHTCFDLAGENVRNSLSGTAAAGGITGGAAAGARTLTRGEDKRKKCAAARAEYQRLKDEYERQQRVVAQVADAEKELKKHANTQAMLDQADLIIAGSKVWLGGYWLIAWPASLPYEFLKLLGKKLFFLATAAMTFVGLCATALDSGQRALTASLSGLSKTLLALAAKIAAVVGAAIIPGVAAEHGDFVPGVKGTGNIHHFRAQVSHALRQAQGRRAALQRRYDDVRRRAKDLRARHGSEPLSFDQQNRLYQQVQAAARKVSVACDDEQVQLPNAPQNALHVWPVQ